jgi:hypothetical protein
MLKSVRQASTLAVFLCIIEPSPAADEALSRAAIAKRAKAATALVEVKPSYGSGFCVHPTGLFMTNEHVVRQGTEAVSLVLNAGLKTQKVLKAKVIRRDKILDLALLKVDGDEKFEALELGSDKDLGELTELIACGFPFGTDLARPGEYPAISINVGSVTSLRHDKDHQLHRIQLDAALNRGNSGGPVLDRGGKVVGMVVSGIQGSGVNMAIPVSHLQRFLAPLEIVFTLPAVKAANRHEAFEFTAKTISLLPSKEALDLELILGDGLGKERRFPMKLADGAYRAKAIPIPAQEGPLVYRVEVKYEDGSVRGTAEDRTFRVGEKKVKLSQLRNLRLGPKPEARLGLGQRLEGKLADLEAIPVKVGKQSLRLDLASAVEVNVEAPEEVTALSCTVVARQKGKELKRFSLPLFIEGVSRGKEVRRFEGHSAAVHSVTFSPDGRRALSGGEDQTVRLWEVESGKELQKLVDPIHHSILCVAFSPDGRRALASGPSHALLWDLEKGKELRRFTGGETWMEGVAFSPDGRRVLTVGRGATVLLWDAETGKELHSFTGHSEWTFRVAYSPDGRHALSGSWDKTVRLWEVETGKEVRRLLGHTEGVQSVVFSPDGRRILSSSTDGTIRVWDVQTGKEVRQLLGHTGSVRSVVFSPDGRRALSGGEDGTVRLWDAGTGTELHRFEGHTGAVRSVACSPCGRYALSAGADRSVRLWRLPAPAARQ